MSFELFSASPAIVNYSVVNYSRQGKLRRLWRLAVATQPPIADNLSVPLRGTMFRWMYRTYPQRRCFAACSGFHDIGPAPRNPQLILNLLPFVAAWLPQHNAQSAITSFACVRGCVAKAGRHSLLGLHCLLIYNLTDKLQFIHNFKYEQTGHPFLPSPLYKFAKPFIYRGLARFLSDLFCHLSNL